MFVSKYRPKNLNEFVSHKEVVPFFLEWVKTRKPKALLLYGPPGTGKTSLVEAFASEKNYDIVEMNASDFRSAKAIQEIIGKSVMQKSLFKKDKIFVIDEVDGLSNNDRGGSGEIIKIIAESSYPIVLTANNPWDKKLRTLRQYCKLIEFKKIPIFDIEKKLQKICESENIKLEKDVLREIAVKANGDLRAAINDLETVAYGSNENLEDVGQREKMLNIFDALKMIFKTKSVLAAKLAAGSTDKDTDELFWWIENNIANEYEDKQEIADAFEKISKADLIMRRIVKKQNWKLLPYAIDMMTAGVSLSKKDVYKKFTRYSYPDRIAMMGAVKGEKAATKELYAKLSNQLHCSMKSLTFNFLPYLRIISKNKIDRLAN